MATWLSWRLGMPVVFSPTSGLDWGHAVLTHYPVTRHDEFALPPPGLPLARGFAYHEIAVGDEGPLLLINTHLHHIRKDATIREQQVASILHFLEGIRDIPAFAESCRKALARKIPIVALRSGVSEMGARVAASRHQGVEVAAAWALAAGVALAAAMG